MRRERHARELNFMRFGYTSLVGLASEADGVLRLHYPERGDYLLINRAHAAAHPPPAPRPRPRRESRPSTPVDPEDALPGFPYVSRVHCASRSAGRGSGGRNGPLQPCRNLVTYYGVRSPDLTEFLLMTPISISKYSAVFSYILAFSDLKSDSIFETIPPRDAASGETPCGPLK